MSILLPYAGYVESRSSIYQSIVKSHEVFPPTRTSCATACKESDSGVKPAFSDKVRFDSVCIFIVITT